MESYRKHHAGRRGEAADFSPRVEYSKAPPFTGGEDKIEVESQK